MDGPQFDSTAAAGDGQVYNRSFWLAYAANVLLVCANSLTFRFAEFVAALGGSEELSGEIVQAGLIAAILVRFELGRAIDRCGPRLVWLVSALAYVGGSAAFLLAERLSPFLWGARIVYQVGLAGMFSCSIVHIQDQVPPHRRTEIIGSLGSSGFLGTIVGTQLSDLLFHLLSPGSARFAAMFAGAALLGTLHAAVVFVLTRDDVHHSPEVTTGPFRLLFRHWPGAVTVVAVAMGTTFAVTTVFLTRYATGMKLSGIGMFFLPYSLTAFGCRWFLRDWGTSFGRHKMVLWGLAGLTAGQLLFLPVGSAWMFIFPAVVCGFGHSLLFPAVVSIGAGRFPVQHRGSGTTLVLGFIELGTAIAAPILGWLIDAGNFGSDVRGFRWMFLAASAVAGCAGLIYAATAARRPDRDAYDRKAASGLTLVEAESDTGDLVSVPAAEPMRGE
ncbi:MAG: MFS transporter [Planctomycetaceae bacterium]